MKYPQYESYKESGIDWLGQVPESWIVKKIKWDTAVLRGASPRPIDDPVYFDDDGDYAWVRIADVTASGKFLEKTTQRLSALGASLSVKMQPKSLFLSIAGSVGKPCITNIKCCIHDGFVYFPFLKINQDFLYFIFAGGESYKGLGKLGTQLNLNTETVGSISIAIPTNIEQQYIVNFLDKETTRLDALIAKKQQLIETLKEKRIAVISQAVTKGLNPDVAMKDSGVEWLGEVPEHWKVKKVKYIFENLDRKRIPLAGEDRAILEKIYPYYGASGIIDYVDDFIFDEPLILVAEDGANLYSRSTPLAFIANGKYWVNNHAHILKPKFGNIYYWELVLQLFDYTPHISGSAQPKLTSERLGTIVLPVPNSMEQDSIIIELQPKIEKVDDLISKTQKAIDKLIEYETALISAAVTGKIKVPEQA